MASVERPETTTVELNFNEVIQVKNTAHELVRFLPNQDKFLKLVEKFAGHKLTGEEKTYWLEQRQDLLNQYQTYGGNKNPAAFGRTWNRASHLLESYLAEKKLSPEQVDNL